MFIVIEGIDGAGHGTQTKLLVDYLKNKGKKVTIIRTPNNQTPIGQAYYSYLRKEFELNKEAVFLLCAADVISNKSIIEQPRKKNEILVSERYITSTIAFQGANGFPLEKSLEVIKAVGFPKADVIIYLDIPVEVGMERKAKVKQLDRHESNKEFLERVKKFYMEEIKNNILGKWFIVDGNKSIEQVHKQIINLLKSNFNL